MQSISSSLKVSWNISLGIPVSKTPAILRRKQWIPRILWQMLYTTSIRSTSSTRSTAQVGFYSLSRLFSPTSSLCALCLWHVRSFHRACLTYLISCVRRSHLMHFDANFHYHFHSIIVMFFTLLFFFLVFLSFAEVTSAQRYEKL